MMKKFLDFFLRGPRQTLRLELFDMDKLSLSAPIHCRANTGNFSGIDEDAHNDDVRL